MAKVKNWELQEVLMDYIIFKESNYLDEYELSYSWKDD